jgi:ABC-type molybdate transport system substrate-binding protein
MTAESHGRTAKAFFTYMLSDEAREIFRRHDFLTLD